MKVKSIRIVLGSLDNCSEIIYDVENDDIYYDSCYDLGLDTLRELMEFLEKVNNTKDKIRELVKELSG